MRQRKIGDVEVGAVGLGAMHLSFADDRNDDNAVEVIRAALESGLTLIDTARAYTTLDHESHNEWVIARALKRLPLADQAVVATKGGHFRAGESEFPIDARPATLRRHCEDSLRWLGRETIDVYQLHWPDPKVPLTDSVGELATLQQEGKIRSIGVCNVSLDQLETARSVAAIASVQNRVSVFDPVDEELIAYCEGAGIAVLCYSPLGGRKNVQNLERDFPDLVSAATEMGCTIHQLALAWILALSPVTVPIPGTGRPSRVAGFAGAAEIELTPAAVAALPRGR